MKKRSSLEKAEWSDSREENYKKYSLEIAFKNGYQLIERGGSIYKIQNEIETLLCHPDQPKRPWFKTWLKIKAV